MSFVSKALIATLLCFLGLLGALSYAVLGGSQMVQSSSSRSGAFQVAQFRADVRTVAGAISYLLEPEPGDVAVESNYTVAVKDSPAKLRTAS